MRTYHQTARAAAAEEKTERILAAALELFVELPFDQITLASVAERANVGLQTLIRRVGTKDGLVGAVNDWIAPQVERDRGEPTSDPAAVAAAIARHNARWGEVSVRTVAQQDSSPALLAAANFGRRSHHEWIAACFEPQLARLTANRRRQITARLVAVSGAELWMVLTRDEGLSLAEARSAVAELIDATLASVAEGARS